MTKERHLRAPCCAFHSVPRFSLMPTHRPTVTTSRLEVEPLGPRCYIWWISARIWGNSCFCDISREVLVAYPVCVETTECVGQRIRVLRNPPSRGLSPIPSAQRRSESEAPLGHPIPIWGKMMVYGGNEEVSNGIRGFRACIWGISEPARGFRKHTWGIPF